MPNAWRPRPWSAPAGRLPSRGAGSPAGGGPGTASSHLMASLAGRRAGGPRRGDLDPGRAQLPDLADQRAGDVQADGRDVLAERAIGQLAAKLFHPPVQVLPGVGVDSLLGAAVGGLVHLLVAAEAEHAYLDTAGHRPLVDRGPALLARPVRILATAGVHRDHARACHVSRR